MSNMGEGSAEGLGPGMLAPGPSAREGIVLVADFTVKSSSSGPLLAAIDESDLSNADKADEKCKEEPAHKLGSLSPAKHS